jgi:hypothetical protein
MPPPNEEHSFAKICPKCGSPQAWECWRLCLCGYDFGPPLKPPQDRGKLPGLRPPAKKLAPPPLPLWRIRVNVVVQTACLLLLVLVLVFPRRFTIFGNLVWGFPLCVNLFFRVPAKSVLSPMEKNLLLLVLFLVSINCGLLAFAAEAWSQLLEHAFWIPGGLCVGLIGLRFYGVFFPAASAEAVPMSQEPPQVALTEKRMAVAGCCALLAVSAGFVLGPEDWYSALFRALWMTGSVFAAICGLSIYRTDAAAPAGKSIR